MTKYIPSLNGLRAFAITLVLISHLTHTPNFPQFINNAFQSLGLGTLGVRLFFLLSGYLITHVLLIEYKSTGRISIKNFFARRVLRIFPSFYFYLAFLAFLAYFEIIQISYEAILLAFLYIQNYNVWQNGEVFVSTWFVKHAWSLSVEEQFYLIYPFLFKNTLAKIKNSFLIIGVGVVVTGTFFRALNYSFPEISRWVGGPFFMHVDFLFVGCLMRYIIVNYKYAIKSIFSSYKDIILGLAFILVLISSIHEYKTGINIVIFGNLILLGNTVIFSYFLLYPESSLGVLFETKPLSFIGKLSYSLYVWQQLFLGSTSLWLKYKYLTYFPINIIAIFICALFS
ncbi:MAG: acyltransferase [Cyclobacteriaceae bacterium]|nr:acyltransferase [Cyclobacteriaceae bacterium]